MADYRLQKTRDSYRDEQGLRMLDEALNRHCARLPATQLQQALLTHHIEREREAMAYMQRLQDLQMEHDESRTP